MCMLQFGKEDPPITNKNANNGNNTANNRLDENDSGIDKKFMHNLSIIIKQSPKCLIRGCVI